MAAQSLRHNYYIVSQNCEINRHQMYIPILYRKTKMGTATTNNRDAEQMLFGTERVRDEYAHRAYIKN